MYKWTLQAAYLLCFYLLACCHLNSIVYSSLGEKKNCHCGLSSGLKTPCSVHIYTLLIQKEWQHTANSISPALCLRVCVRLCSSGDYLTWHLFIYHVPFHQQGLMHIPQVEAKREMLTGIFTLISIMIIVQAWCLEIIPSEKEIMLLTL